MKNSAGNIKKVREVFDRYYADDEAERNNPAAWYNWIGFMATNYKMKKRIPAEVRVDLSDGFLTYCEEWLSENVVGE
jgi:hypothetical protein